MLFLSLAQSRGLQPGASATFLRLFPLELFAPEAPPTPAGAVSDVVDSGAASPPLRGASGGAIKVLEDDTCGATDFSKAAALDEEGGELVSFFNFELCLCALFKLGNAGGMSSSWTVILGPSLALSKDSASESCPASSMFVDSRIVSRSMLDSSPNANADAIMDKDLS